MIYLSIAAAVVCVCLVLFVWGFFHFAPKSLPDDKPIPPPPHRVINNIALLTYSASIRGRTQYIFLSADPAYHPDRTLGSLRLHSGDVITRSLDDYWVEAVVAATGEVYSRTAVPAHEVERGLQEGWIITSSQFWNLATQAMVQTGRNLEEATREISRAFSGLNGTMNEVSHLMNQAFSRTGFTQRVTTTTRYSVEGREFASLEEAQRFAEQIVEDNKQRVAVIAQPVKKQSNPDPEEPEAPHKTRYDLIGSDDDPL